MQMLLMIFYELFYEGVQWAMLNGFEEGLGYMSTHFGPLENHHSKNRAFYRLSASTIGSSY